MKPFATFGVAVFLLAVSFSAASRADETRPNVLLIFVDDLNDWTGCLKGHPQSLTPNIDKLAKTGTLFSNAHCQAPVCQPSRSSMLTSRYPSSTGLYFLNPGIRQSTVTKNVLTLPERFHREGYQVLGAGKIFHHQLNKVIFSKLGEYGGNFGGFGPLPKQKINYRQGVRLWDWGPLDISDDKMPDHKIASWAVSKLQQKHEKPFFMAIGFYRPHVPLYVPRKWLDKFPLDKIQLPATTERDLGDVSKYARDLVTLKHIAPLHDWMKKNDQWQTAVGAYLASIAFADDCAGRVLNTLAKSSYRDNTIVVLCSDHGFHLGEKQRWAKRSLWEDSTRVPLIISGPGIKSHTCSRPVGLIDIYPTLLDLCGLKADKTHEGQSLKPLLDSPNMHWKRPVRTTFGKGNHSIRSTNWRYIRYVDGSEELYHTNRDPHEWKNLAADSRYSEIIREHRKWLPKREKGILGKNSTGHKAYEASSKNLK